MRYALGCRESKFNVIEFYFENNNNNKIKCVCSRDVVVL